MKLRVPKLPTCLLVGLVVALWPGVNTGALAADTATPVEVQTPPPLEDHPGATTSVPSPTASAPSPKASPAAKRGSKRNEPTDGTPRPARVKQAKPIPYPVPMGEPSSDVKIPELKATGELLSLLSAVKLTRTDNEHVEMHEAKIDLYHPDGKEDFHVVMPTSVLNLVTHVISSDHPVTIKTQDFELTGERMQFNTVDRMGELQGNVHMVIHNLKQIAGATPAAPAP